jgi:hypothetical protein
LLAGLIEDGEGNRFTSSFTVKSGRRYRYYVSRPAEKSGSGESKEWARVPAHEVESRVMEKFREFLKSDTDLIDGAAETGEGPATLAPLVTAAKKLAARSSIHSTDLRALIILLFQRVVIRESQIQIEIWRARLREILENGNEINSDHLAGVQKSTDSSDIIYLTIEAKRKRYGGEIHLVIPPSSGVPVRHPATSSNQSRCKGSCLAPKSARRGSRRYEITGPASRPHATLCQECFYLCLPRARHRGSNPRRTSASRIEVRAPLQGDPVAGLNSVAGSDFRKIDIQMMLPCNRP